MARCDVALQPLWRYVKDRHRSCDDTWSSGTNLKKYSFLFSLVAELHVSSQQRWRSLTYRHRSCGATSRMGAHLVTASLVALLANKIFRKHGLYTWRFGTVTVARCYILRWSPRLFTMFIFFPRFFVYCLRILCSARIYGPSFRETKPKTLVFSHTKWAFWACFRENWAYNFGHW